MISLVVTNVLGQMARSVFARPEKISIYLITVLTVLVQLSWNNFAYANPEDGVVAAGQANIEKQKNGVLQVTQTSSNAIVNWSTFNIATHEHTHFQQPDGGVILNRVNSNNGVSQIFGQLSATGTVVLVNQAGVFFGPHAQVNVTGIITSTADISDQNFMRGKYIFDQAGLPSASIVNKGAIAAKEHGLVALLGYNIRNDGLIQAKLGKVVLAHGEKFTVDMYGDRLINFTIDTPTTNTANENIGVENSGTIKANGSDVLLTAQAAEGVLDQVVNMSGIIDATNVVEHAGKIIFQGGENCGINISGTADVSSTTGSGGEISAYGKQVAILPLAELRASGSKHGGNIILKSKQATTSHGKVSVCASEHGGSGGTIEFSSDGIVDFDATKIDARTISDGVEVGNRGNFIIDPQFLVVQTTSGSAYSTGVNNLFANNVGSTTTLTPASIDLAATVANITLQANTDVMFVDPLTLTTAGSTLTVQAGRSVLIQNTVSTNNAAIAITANDNTATSADRLTTSTNNPPGDTETISGNIVMSGSGSLSSGTSALNLTVGSSNTAPFSSGTMTLLGLTSGALTINTPNAATCSSSINASTLTKQGNGTLTLSAANTISNSIAVSAGTLSTSISTGLGATASGISVSAGAALDLNFTSATLGNTNTITLNGTGIGGVGALTFSGNSITINNPLTISTTTTIGGTGSGTMTLGDTTTGAVNANLTFNLANAGLAASTITLTGTGILSATTGGALTQSGLFTVPGVSSFNAGANQIALTQNNQLTGAVTLSNSGANDVSLTNNRATVLAASTVGQNLTVTTTGALTQTGILTVPGTSSFASGAFAMTLTQNNQLTGAITLNNSGANSVSLTNNRATLLGATTIGQNLTVTSAGAITQNGILTVPGTSSFSAGANAITLSQNNVLTGAITLTNSGANNVAITNNRATLLAASTVGQNFSLTSVGAITQAGVLTVPGTSSFSAGAFAMTLTQSNVLTGAITLSNSGANNISLTNNRATLLATSTIGQNLAITAAGAITQNGILTVPGTASFTAGANPITLTQNNVITGAITLSNSGANDASITNNRATVLATSTIGRNFSLISGGSVTQAGALTATGGATTISSTAANSDITLSQANNLGTTAPVFAGTLANIRDLNLRNTNAGATLPIFSTLTSLRNLTLTFNAAAISLPTISLASPGALSVTAGGAITQTGVLTVPGTSTFAAGAFPITLTQNNLFTGAVALSNSGANAVSLTNAQPLVLGVGGLGNNLTVNATGAITQTGILTVPGTSSFTAGANPITLTQNNQLTGATTLSNSGANDVTLMNNRATVLAASTVGQNLSITALGALTQTGILTIPGTSSFSAGAFPITLTLNNVLTGGITLSNSGANAVSLTNNRATLLAASTIGQNLTISSVGALTQNGALTVPGTASFTAGANPITLTQNNVITGAITLSNSGANAVSLTNNRATILAASTVGQNLSVTTAGALTQTGILTIPGTASFTAGANPITLTQNNLITGAISLSNSGANAVSLTNNRATILAASTVGQNLSVTAAGALTQTGALTATDGTLTISSTAANSDILLTQDNDLGTTAPVFAGTLGNIRDVSITNTNSGASVPILNTLTSLRNLSLNYANAAIALPAVTLTSGGSTSLTAGGAITQSGIFTVPGTSSFTAGANAITLTQNNQLTGAITLSNSGANDVSVTNATATVLAASSIGQNLTVTSNGAITQSGALTVPGTSNFTSSAFPITLTQSNVLTGAVALSNSGTNNASLTNTLATSLGTSTVGQNFTLVSGGSVTQTGALTTTGGTLTISSTAANSDILLTQANDLGTTAPVFTGTLGNIRDVSITNTNAGSTAPNLSSLTSLRNLSLNFANAAIELPEATLTSGGSMSLTAGGAITQSGIFTVPGTSSFTAAANAINLPLNNLLTGAITLSNSGTNDASVTNATATALAASTIGQNFNLISGGSVTQTGALTATGGTLTISSTATNSDVLLTQNNNLGASAPVFAGTVGNIRDVSITNTNAGSTAPNLSSLTSLRNLSLNYANAAIALPAVTLTSGGSMSLTAGGAITQSGIFTVPGTSIFTAGSNPITLTQNNAFTGAVSLSNSGANNVSITNNQALGLSTSTIGQNLTVVANGNITQTGSVTVNGTANLNSGTADISFADLISTGTTMMVANNTTGAITVGGLQLTTNLANLTGSVAGLTGQAAIPIIVNTNTITAGTHFFDGIDMFIRPTPPAPSTLLQNNAVLQIIYAGLYSGASLFYDVPNLGFDQNSYIVQRDRKNCTNLGSSIELCNKQQTTAATKSKSIKHNVSNSQQNINKQIVLNTNPKANSTPRINNKKHNINKVKNMNYTKKFTNLNKNEAAIKAVTQTTTKVNQPIKGVIIKANHSIKSILKVVTYFIRALSRNS